MEADCIAVERVAVDIVEVEVGAVVFLLQISSSSDLLVIVYYFMLKGIINSEIMTSKIKVLLISRLFASHNLSVERYFKII